MSIPQLGRPVETACDYLVSVRHIESHGVDHVFVVLERDQLLARDGVPDFASPVVSPGKEFVAIFVKGAVGQGKEMRLQNLEALEVLLFIGVQLLDEF